MIGRVKRSYYKRVVGVFLLLAGIALVRPLLENPVSRIFVSGESLDVTREELLKRWEPWENVYQNEMELYLSKGDISLEVLCAPSGPFQFTGEHLEIPGGSVRRGQSRSEVQEILGPPYRTSDAPERGEEFSHEGHEWLNSFGTVVARFIVTYRIDQVYEIVAAREDRREEFHNAHGHDFQELRE